MLESGALFDSVTRLFPMSANAIAGRETNRFWNCAMRLGPATAIELGGFRSAV